MKSAERANYTRVRNKMNWVNFQRFSLILLLLLASNLGFAQQKNLNTSQLQQDLTEVTLSIEKIDQKITHINSRLEGIPLENIDPQMMTRLNDLEIKKDQLERRKISIEAALNSAQNSNDPNDSPAELESSNKNLH